jgi:hypothetical protein
LHLVKYQSKKMYREAFLALVLCADEWSVSRPSNFTPEKYKAEHNDWVPEEPVGMLWEPNPDSLAALLDG